MSTIPLRRATRARRERELQAHLDAAERLLAELDVEDGDADLEPSLGAPEALIGALRIGRHSRGLDQRRWAQGGDCGERELVSEDEGAQCEGEGSWRDGDDEPDRDGEGTANPRWRIAGRLMTEVDGPNAWRPLDPDDDPGQAAVQWEVGMH